jgi:hypothetical protein
MRVMVLGAGEGSASIAKDGWRSGLGEGQRVRPAASSPSSRSHFVVARFGKTMSSPACRAPPAAIVVST